MPYPALPDHRMPYDNDGTLVYVGTIFDGAGLAKSGADLVALNGHPANSGGFGATSTASSPTEEYIFFFFPEQREITGVYAYIWMQFGHNGLFQLRGSNDTTNGSDGTWETASLPGGISDVSDVAIALDRWRSQIKAVSFTGPKKNLKIAVNANGSGGPTFRTVHLYGEAAAGQMAHDLIYLDPDLGAGVAFPAPEDFGDQPLGTTVVRPFRVKNTSATKTATNINIQCNDPDFTIGESASGPWVVTINIASLGPGVESATLYTRCTTPAPGAALKPRFARIVTVCDAGFFG